MSGGFFGGGFDASEPLGEKHRPLSRICTLAKTGTQQTDSCLKVSHRNGPLQSGRKLSLRKTMHSESWKRPVIKRRMKAESGSAKSEGKTVSLDSGHSLRQFAESSEPQIETKPELSATNETKEQSAVASELGTVSKSGSFVPRIDFGKVDQWLCAAAPKGAPLIQTQILRKKGAFGKLFPKYEVFLRESRSFLMHASKRSSKTSNYTICSDPNVDRHLCKVRANFVGSEFVIYDGGVNPQRAESKKVRKEIGSVIYESNIFGSKGPRKMTALIPKNVETAQWQPSASKGGLLIASHRQGATQGFHQLGNRAPKWNAHIGAYILNFNGRVTHASVKNFQLVVANGDEDDVILQFGRVAPDNFTMDFKHPLSAIQAFAICLTSFDHKLACE